MRLLVVEDDLLLRNAMVRALKAEGFKVDDVENGKEGLWFAQQGIYDVILLDIMLPEMDSLSIIKELHDKSVMPLIVLVTARDSVEDRVMDWKSELNITWLNHLP
jgi:two-component system response regulator CiaR